MSHQSPLVSIIIPCYNQVEYLEETVLSALASDYSPIEIIIINDGSTDGSEEIAKNLALKQELVSYIHQKNQGVEIARNTGIKATSGKYILPLDGDDLIATNYISEAVKVLENNPQVKVVYCEAMKFGPKGKKYWKLKPFDINALARDNMIFVSALYKRTDWEKIGGYAEDYNLGRADWEFWINMLKDGGEVVQLPFIGFYYRLTGGVNSLRKRTGSDEAKRKRIAYLNAKYPEFFERELNGPLRFQRTWSKPYNTLLKFLGKL
ncbi:glycosyltransferase [Algoriphagus lutimaris]|uniref:glycosyltransferase n=1 Tax=Algoriphagus lutimaris TaxID=613197 RepID=UPI00196B32A0|nr:glycosyltransferase [Algoriphagus lutimaris]MBN3520468.1 glycosyltransferase [Algoriphagus lutimaris]